MRGDRAILRAGPRVAALAVATSFLACASIPHGRYAIDSVEVVGARLVDPKEVLDKLATSESPKFLGLVRGLASDYTIYDASVFQRDLARVERFYRGRGFFEAHALVGRVEHVGTDHVRVQIVVAEGAPVLNGDVRVDGLGELPAAVADAAHLAGRSALPQGKRFDEASYRDAASAVSRVLSDRGYAYVKVQADAQVDLASHSISYVLSVTPGPAAVYGPIVLAGLDPDGAGPAPQEIPDTIILRVLHLREGDAFSTDELRTAEQALLDLEVFSAVHINPQLSDPPEPIVPLVVQLEPSQLRAIRLGGGFEFDAIKTDIHALVGWEDHNFLGNLRDFSVDFKPGVDLYPTHVPTGKERIAPTDLMLEEKLRMQLRQPGFLEPRTVGFVRPELNVYPLLVGQTASQNVVGYVEPKTAFGLNRRFGNHFTVTAAYNVQGELPIKYKGELDPALPTLLLAFPQLTAKLDFTDDPVRPHAGLVANADFQLAVGPTGGWASDLRIQPDVEGYIPIARGVTFALTASLGLLFPYNYGGTIRDKASIEPPSDTNGYDRDIETTYFRGFFSGGPSSNRGYPLRGVSPHAYVPFLNPAVTQGTTSAQCPLNPMTRLPPQTPECSSPIGGFTQWEASAELRAAVSGPFGVAFFCDAGDVSQYVFPDPGSLRINYLHMSCGAGVRYDTPVGPVRLDIAYRIPGLQLVGYPNEAAALAHDPTFGAPPTLFSSSKFKGLPIGIAFGIGEAF